MRSKSTFVPLVCGIALAIGIVIGSALSPGFSGLFSGADETKKKLALEKIRDVFTYVQGHYVDTINPDKLTDKTLESMLQALDPHSDYFTADEIQAMNEPLQGNFEGIGIEYNFIRDTLVVMAIVPGGPSEKAGLKPGDRLIRADMTWIVGPNASEKYVKSILRGKANTQVNVRIVRPGVKEPFDKAITRGTVPIYSVQAKYMLDKETGYIKLVRFSETSYAEFQQASDTLLAHGMKKLVLDLRDNGGGFLDAATNIADEFLPEGKLIVFTKGRTDGEHKTFATSKGKLEKVPLAVLVNENSASASEILAGAIQDNDRGIIVGRRTFGKGLVQEEQTLRDGSAFRLTIARYYTPTGRCIQKPYDHGIEAYQAEEEARYKHGELLHADSIHFPDSLKFKTPKGKTVYGGGGIMPDIFVPLDTSGGSHLLTELFNKDIISLWSLDYSLTHETELQKGTLPVFRQSFAIDDQMTGALIALGELNGVKNNGQLDGSKSLLQRYMKAGIARSLWGEEGYYEVWNEGDTFIEAALKELQRGS